MYVDPSGCWIPQRTAQSGATVTVTAGGAGGGENGLGGGGGGGGTGEFPEALASPTQTVQRRFRGCGLRGACKGPAKEGGVAPACAPRQASRHATALYIACK